MLAGIFITLSVALLLFILWAIKLGREPPEVQIKVVHLVHQDEDGATYGISLEEDLHYCRKFKGIKHE